MKACGRTKFCMLRPEHVVEVGAGGSHNVCMCEKQQNVELIVDALCRGKIEKYMFMNYIVCDIKSQDCMMKKFTHCPGINFLKPKLVELLDNRATIKYKMWISTDRTMLEDEECTASTFVDTLLDKIKKLIMHHFISKEQSKVCREFKEKITPEECLIQGDFSQNYSMLVQDSTQL